MVEIVHKILSPSIQGVMRVHVINLITDRTL
jgi:hypothetical protein